MRSRERPQSAEAKLEMTPMIDVVFLLLIFLVMVSKPLDQLSRFSTMHPTARPVEPVDPPTLITIALYENNLLTLNGTPVTPAEMDSKLARIAKFSTTASILLKSSSRASHGGLVQAMDICHANSFSNLVLTSF